MMLTTYPAAGRGQFENHWLKARHSFSFANHYDPNRMGVSVLRVLNQDEIAPHSGFDTHPHDNMEIVTYPLSGALTHRDSMGHHGTINAGEIQRISAGTGIMHSEHNEGDTPVHLLQIWLLPNEQNIAPDYEQKAFSNEQKHNRLQCIIDKEGFDGALTASTDARLYASLLDQHHRIEHHLPENRVGYIHLAEGEITVNGMRLKQGDGLKIDANSALELIGYSEQANVLLFELP